MKVKLFQKSKNIIAIEDKELGRVLIKPLPITPKCTEWYPLHTGKLSMMSMNVSFELKFS